VVSRAHDYEDRYDSDLGGININNIISKRSWGLGHHSDACFATCMGLVLLYTLTLGCMASPQKLFRQPFRQLPSIEFFLSFTSTQVQGRSNNLITRHFTREVFEEFQLKVLEDWISRSCCPHHQSSPWVKFLHISGTELLQVRDPRMDHFLQLTRVGHHVHAGIGGLKVFFFQG
jgi:hypothetical protein